MQIKSLHTDTKEYTDFIRKEASVYNTPEWLKLYGNKCKVMGVYENDSLVAVFNTFSFKKAVLSFFIPPPFMPDCALLISNKANREDVTTAIKTWVEKKAASSSYSQFKFNFSYEYSDLFSEPKIKGLNTKWNHTYVLDISQTDDVQSLYAAKRRQQIRRAVKDGLSVEHLDDLRVVFRLVMQTFLRQKKNVDESFIKKIIFDFANSSNSFAFAAIKEGKPIVAYFCIFHNNEAFYLLGGYDETEKHIGAGPLAMNACIEHAKKIGIETYDFEGSMEPSIEKYFKEFGGTKKLYACFERSSKLGEMAVKLKRLIKG